jgi:hypothetical protein
MRLSNIIKVCRPICELERQREHIGSIWSRVTCLALPLATAQSCGRQALELSQSRWQLTIAIRNKQYKQINKQYTKEYVMSKQIVPKDATHRYERMSRRVT